ncbi:MAG: hypothetical protein DRH34_00930 [Deltaproteobacteria bacterium]|nr:MAG: hypothetical protein DRH34_00930 [Deltaproteobacteria bacterium]RLC23114.1 MAG: hypothetical protein DRH93_08190 [Deltaproteobacteria bacterium]
MNKEPRKCQQELETRQKRQSIKIIPFYLEKEAMMMTDLKGVVCAVIYGQDQRTPISPNTRRALYVTYVPPGIETESVTTHLDAIRKNIILFAPDADVEYQKVHTA